MPLYKKNYKKIYLSVLCIVFPLYHIDWWRLWAWERSAEVSLANDKYLQEVDDWEPLHVGETCIKRITLFLSLPIFFNRMSSDGFSPTAQLTVLLLHCGVGACPAGTFWYGQRI